jgi:hypothetical protein
MDLPDALCQDAAQAATGREAATLTPVTTVEG